MDISLGTNGLIRPNIRDVLYPNKNVNTTKYMAADNIYKKFGCRLRPKMSGIGPKLLEAMGALYLH